MSVAEDWYYRTYLHAPKHDSRCLAVLAAWRPLYNITRTGANRLDGGFRPCGTGIEVRVQKDQSFATYDDDSLTRLVVAAHRECCRVEISAAFGHIILRVHPRSPDGTSLYERHRSSGELAAMAEGVTA